MQKLPTVPTGQEILDRAFRRAEKAQSRGRTPLERARADSLARVSAFTDTVRTALRRVYRSFPSLERLHPFYRELVDLLAGVETARRDLGALRWAELQVDRVAREARRDIPRGRDVGDTRRARKACYGRVASLVHQVDGALERLGTLRNALRTLPTVEEDVPTVVVAGAPNVGKSQLVQTLSRARPRVASYPFTTQDLSLGHREVDGARIQIMDTPGLLDRPPEERNDVERRALVALRHVADLILFLLDPTGTCGFPLEDQESLLRSLRAVFPETPFLEVENRSDVGAGTGTRPHISALTGAGVDELVTELGRRLTSPDPASEPPPGAP